jgi:hypothetical protein
VEPRFTPLRRGFSYAQKKAGAALLIMAAAPAFALMLWHSPGIDKHSFPLRHYGTPYPAARPFFTHCETLQLFTHKKRQTPKRLPECLNFLVADAPSH